MYPDTARWLHMSRGGSPIYATVQNRERFTNCTSYHYIHVTRSTQYQFLILHSYEMYHYHIDISCSTPYFDLICCCVNYTILGKQYSISLIIYLCYLIFPTMPIIVFHANDKRTELNRHPILPTCEHAQGSHIYDFM